MLQLLCVGEMVIDFLPGDEDGMYIRKPGGAPANVAVAAARNSIRSGFCGTVGNDDFGRFLLDTLRSNHVEVLCPQLVDEAVTTMAFVSLDSEGERHFTFARKPGADMFLTCADVDAALGRGADIVHAGSCTLSSGSAAEATAYAVCQGKALGKLVSFDVNYRSLMWNNDREGCARAVGELLPMIDFLKISEEETDIIGMPIEEAAQKYQIAAAVQTLGAEGAKCVWNGKTLFAPGRKAHCVDATGSGDAFWGSFLSCILHEGVRSTQDLTEDILMKALKYGNVAGWLCVQKKGAMESLPTRQEIQRIMEEDA